MDFTIPRYLLLDLLQRLDRFITGAERMPGAITTFIEANFDDDDEEFADLLGAMGSTDENLQVAACRAAAARINDVLRFDWMEE